MAKTCVLRGMTWDHSRGFDPMVATAQRYAQEHNNVQINWEKRSLQAFADRPLEQMVGDYDLMVIDHPHVGAAARSGLLLALDGIGRDAELKQLAAQTVGASHRSYEFDDHQWALAIDAATPVASFRADRIEAAPTRWNEVLELARNNKVALALIPINALMGFFGLARNHGFAVAQSQDELIERAAAKQVLNELQELAGLVASRCLSLDPIDVLEWMGRNEDAPVYCPFGYGYTNYSRADYCAYPITFAAAHRDSAVDYAFWIANAECQAGLYFASGGQPGNAVAWDSDECNNAAGNFFRNTRRTLETAWLRPRYAGYMDFQDVAGQIVHDCISKTITDEVALDRLQNAYVASRR